MRGIYPKLLTPLMKKWKGLSKLLFGATGGMKQYRPSLVGRDIAHGTKTAAMTPTCEQFQSGFQAYRMRYAKQEGLRQGSYVDLVGTTLSKLPKLSSVHISLDPDGHTFLHWRDCKNTWILRNCLEVLVGQRLLVPHWNGTVDRGDVFIYNVFDTLKKAGVQPRELRFIHSHGLGCRFDWNRVGSLDFLCKLQVLQISVRGAARLKLNAFPNWKSLFEPLQHARDLQRLSIEFDTMIFPFTGGYPEQCTDGILDLRFPLLRELHLDRFHNSREGFQVFLEAHLLIEHFSQTFMCDAEQGQYDWPAYWNAIRNMRELKSWELVCGPPVDIVDDNSRTRSERPFLKYPYDKEEDVELLGGPEHELREFLCKRSGWTERLSQWWRMPELP